MKRHCAVWLAVSVLSSAASGIGVAVAAAACSAAASEPRPDLVTALKATSPNSSLGDQAKVPALLVGTWDVEYTDFGKDGTAIHRTGEFIVGWVMDGRAMQALWIVDPSGSRKDREVYTDLHYFDKKSRTWHSAFVDPENGSVARFTGSATGNDRYVLETQDMGNKKTRWSYINMRTDSFVYRDEASSDGGKTWRLQAEYHMKRRDTDPSVQAAASAAQCPSSQVASTHRRHGV